MSTAQQPSIQVLPTPQAVAEAAARRVVEAAQRALDAKETFTVALAGGSTPKAAYELLAREPLRSQIDWARVEVFFGDERCVPPESADSNYRMAHDALLAHVPIPGDNVYRMHGESDPNQAAVEYGKMLKDRFGDGGMDLVLLGMGDDGHTASLFPDTEAIGEAHHRCVANFVPKLRTWRITLSAPFINRSAEVLVLVTGEGKAKRVAEVLEGVPDPQRLPIQLIRPVHGTLTWLLDAAAAGMNEGD